MLRKDLPIRTDLIDSTVASAVTTITVYANPIIAKVRTNLNEEPGGTIPPPTLWTPSEIATELWVDALTEASITKPSNIVSQWNDLSGNERHLTQSNSSFRPTYTAVALSGLPSIRFTSDYLDSSGTALSLSNYCLVFLAQINVNPSGIVIAYPVGIGVGGVFWGGSAVSGYIGYAGAGPFIFSAYQPSQSVPAFVSVIADSGVINIYVNGSNLGAASFTANVTQVRLGYRADNNWFFDGDISEFILTANLTSRQKLEGYIAHRYSLQSMLPSGHPYKTFPPYA